MSRFPFYFFLGRLAHKLLTPVVHSTPWEIDNRIHETLGQILNDPTVPAVLEEELKAG